MTGPFLFPEQAEAPAGYIAVPISQLPHTEAGQVKGNRCNYCDWRPDCSALICSCMCYARADRLNVVFRKARG